MKWKVLYIYICRDITPTKENQMEKKMESEMETVGIQGFKEL